MKLLQILADTTSIKISQDDLNLKGAPTAVGATQVETVLNSIYVIAGVVAVIMIIIGGIRYTTSNGDSTHVKSAKDTIFYSVIGLVVIIMASAITNFVINSAG